MKFNDFISACINRGICRKSAADKYISDKPIDYDYTDKDFENVFDFDEGESDWAEYVSGKDCFPKWYEYD